jgi:hypothetical protein
LNEIEPWLSTESLAKGVNWISELKKGLAESNGVGWFFVTQEALNSNWLHFEAGSISALGHERVCPVLVDDLSLTPPLSLFQDTKLNQQDVGRLLRTVNSLLPRPVTEAVLEKSFNRAWPELKQALDDAIKAAPQKAVPKKTVEVGLDDIRKALHGIEARLSRMEANAQTTVSSLPWVNSGQVNSYGSGLLGEVQSAPVLGTPIFQRDELGRIQPAAHTFDGRSVYLATMVEPASAHGLLATPTPSANAAPTRSPQPPRPPAAPPVQRSPAPKPRGKA